jgi:hypothetical protein
LLLLGLVGLGPARLKPSLPISLALAALALYTGGLLLSYHVPCGPEYYQLGLCYQPEYKNWAPAAASSPPLSPQLTLTQEIVPSCSGMQQVLVWVNSPGADLSGLTRFALHTTYQDADLVRRTLKNKDLPRGGWVALDFSPQWSSQDNLYLLTVRSTSVGGVQLGYSLKAEYLKGKLFENGKPVSQDILFQYGCLTGLQKVLKP